MATEKWVSGSGQGLTWGSAFGTEINSLANNKSILSSISITNGTALDIFADVSFVAGGTISVAVPQLLGLYLYPLNEDGSTYGDGQFSTATTGVPSAGYWVGNIYMSATGTLTVAGAVTRIVLPPGTFSFVLNNQMGVALASSNTCKYRTYNRSVA